MASEPTTHVEPLDQGLVTARDQALLQPGELAKADNCVYMPNDPSIRKTKGRTKYNAVAISGSPSVQGLRLLNFDQTDAPLLVAHAGADYFYSSMAGETGTMNSLIPAVGTGVTLESVQYNNRHYLFNGQGTQNWVVNADASSRLHGLQAVDQPPTLAFVTGSWNSGLGNGYYFVMTVEVVNPNSADEVESTNIVGDDYMPSLQYTTTNIGTQSIQVTRPTQVNTSATHWRVYVAGPRQENKPVPARSDFKAMGDQTMANTTLVVGNTTITGTNQKFPSTNSVAVGGGWTNPNNAQAFDSVDATTATHLNATLWRTFGLSLSAGTITGIQVEIRVHGTVNLGTFNLLISLTKDAGANYTAAQNFQFAPVGSSTSDKLLNFVQYRTVTLGGTTNMWGTTWTTAEVASANFGVKVQYYFANPFANPPTAAIDYIKVTVHQVGTSATTQISFGKQFPTIAISVAGITSVIGSHGLPPLATTADIFEGQMVTNDVSDQSRIVYSLPDAVDYFPGPYFINFETRQTDEVTLVKRLGDKLMVGQKTQLFRVNYLPRETDSEFDRGRCYETISEGQGVVGLQAAATFTAPGGPLLMAFVSYSGIHVTDGFQVDTLTDDLDWQNTVDLPSAADVNDYLKKSILVDYPLNYWLVFYYPVVGGTSNSKALVLHYHPSHRKANGKMKATGPIDVAALSATIGRVSDAPVLMTGQTAGFVFVEDRGYTHNAGGTLAVDVRTREMYPWGMDATGTVEGILIRHDQDATSTVTVQPRLREADNAQTTGEAAVTFTTAQAGVASLDFHFFCDSWQLQFTEPGADGGAGMRISALLATVTSHGAPE